MPPNALTARTQISPAEVTAALEMQGYRKGTYVTEYGWEHDRSTCVSMATTYVLNQARIPRGPIAPTDFSALVSAIVMQANTLLLRKSEAGQVLQ